MSEGRIDRALAEKERGLLEADYATPCPECGGVVFEWWDSATCRDCEDPHEQPSTEQTTLMTDGGTNMKRDKAIRRIEEVEDKLAQLVSNANDYAEGTTQTPVVDAGEVDDLRQSLTDARADLVRAALSDVFAEQVEEAEPGDIMIFDEVQGKVERAGKKKSREGRRIEQGDMVEVVESFYDEYNDKEVTEVVGEVGRVDVVRDDDTYLVLFPGARGWFIPEEKLEPADPTDREPWWDESI